MSAKTDNTSVFWVSINLTPRDDVFEDEHVEGVSVTDESEAVVTGKGGDDKTNEEEANNVDELGNNFSTKYQLSNFLIYTKSICISLQMFYLIKAELLEFSSSFNSSTKVSNY